MVPALPEIESSRVNRPDRNTLGLVFAGGNGLDMRTIKNLTSHDGRRKVGAVNEVDEVVHRPFPRIHVSHFRGQCIGKLDRSIRNR